MQKIVNLLEQHVQWIVLGLAGLYLLFMVWSYVINKPVTVEVGGEAVTPGEVDQKTYQDKAELLDQKMHQPQRLPDMPVADPVRAFMASLNTAPKRDLPAIAVFTPATGKLDVPTGTPPPPGQPQPGQPALAGEQAVPAAGQMDALPVLAAATDIKTRHGRSTVTWQDPNNPTNQPTADEDWVTVRYMVKKDTLEKAFVDAKVPQIFMKTNFVRVELMRQERGPTGSWGDETPVPGLKISKLPAWPNTEDKQAVAAYNEWAKGNQLEIVQPPFYTVSKGDFWGVPGEEANEQQTQAVAFDPNREFKPAEFDKLTPEQKKQVMEVRRARAAEAEKARREQQQNRGPRQPSAPGEFAPPPGGPGGGGRRGGAGGPGHASDPDRPVKNFHQLPPPPSGLPQPPMYPGGYPAGEFAPPAWQPQQQANTANFPIPTTEFDPRAITDVTGWAHDDTVEPGKTYRYRIVYKIKNPIYLTGNVVKNAALSDQFEIAAPASEWSEPVSVPALTSFFIAGGFDANTSRFVKFDVYKFENGRLHKQTFNVAPGDVIGRKDKEADFTTGWTVVDIRKDLKNNADLVIIADANGQLYDRSHREDSQDPEMKKLSQQLSQQASAAPGG